MTLAELDRVANPAICEVGRLRSPNAGEGDGHSTLVFARYVSGRHGTLTSVDKDAGTEPVCRKLLCDSHIGDARVSFISQDANDTALWEKMCPIDLLYLDGWDLNDPDSARQHLLCFLLAEPGIKQGGLVLVDDTGMPGLGKGRLVVPVAVLMGWQVLHQGFQTLLRKPA